MLSVMSVVSYCIFISLCEMELVCVTLYMDDTSKLHVITEVDSCNVISPSAAILYLFPGTQQESGKNLRVLRLLVYFCLEGEVSLYTRLWAVASGLAR